MRFVKLLFALWVFCGVGLSIVSAQTSPGAQGAAETGPGRRQEWIIPGLVATRSVHAVLFRPAGDGPFPLAIVAGAMWQETGRRAQGTVREYRTLANWLVARGYAVLVAAPSGPADKGAREAKGSSGCDDVSYLGAGRETADSITATLNYMRGQAFVRPDGDLIIGHSDGGWGTLAMAGRDLSGVAALVVFAPGHGTRNANKALRDCAAQRSIAAATVFGKDAHLPVIWIVARNDTQFTPALSRQMADAFRAGGDKVDFRDLPDFRSDGHALAEAEGGDELYGATLDSALKALTTRPARKR